MNKPSEYKPYINPVREHARQNRPKDPTVCSDPIQAMLGYWGRDAEWCIYLKNQRNGIPNE